MLQLITVHHHVWSPHPSLLYLQFLLSPSLLPLHPMLHNNTSSYEDYNTEAPLQNYSLNNESLNLININSNFKRDHLKHFTMFSWVNGTIIPYRKIMNYLLTRLFYGVQFHLFICISWNPILHGFHLLFRMLKFYWTKNRQTEIPTDSITASGFVFQKLSCKC